MWAGYNYDNLIGSLRYRAHTPVTLLLDQEVEDEGGKNELDLTHSLEM